MLHIPGYRGTWAEIDLQAIAHNVRQFRFHLPAETDVMAIVKADGYGHGALQVAKTALANGASFLGVAFLGEAVQLREEGIDVPILVMGYTDPEYMKIAVEKDISVTVFDWKAIVALEEASRQLGRKGRAHLKVDTGMGRIGIRAHDPELQEMIRYLEASPFLTFEGLFTHYACADEIDNPLQQEQMKLFDEVMRMLDNDKIVPQYVHASNSAAAAQFPGTSHSFVRLGISMYGLYPSSDIKGKDLLSLKQAFSLKSRITHVKKVAAGTTISYGATYVTEKEEMIATIPIGYADGYRRSLSNRGMVLIHGMRSPIVGRVCMDQMMVQVTHIPDVQVGDEVVLIGRQGNEEIDIDEVAGWLDTINYEIPCMIGKRVPRIYI